MKPEGVGRSHRWELRPTDILDWPRDPIGGLSRQVADDGLFYALIITGISIPDDPAERIDDVIGQRFTA